MTIIGVQLILIAFALFMMYVLFLHWNKKNITNKMFAVWMMIWLIFIFFSFFPVILAPLLTKLFIVRVMDLGVIAALMIIVYITLENNIKIKKQQDELEKLVRGLAIKRAKK